MTVDRDRLRAPCWTVVAALLAAACAAGPSGPRVIHLDELPRRPSYDIEWIRSDRDAAALAMAIMEREVGVPRLDASLYFFPNREAFQQALVDSGYDAAFAEQTASRMDAVGGHRLVLLNAGSLGRLSWPSRVGFLAHELTHTLQYELSGGRRGVSDQWLREGFADWVTSRVLAALGVASTDAFRRGRLADYRGSTDGPSLALDRMVTFEQWVGLAEDGRWAVPAKAFLAVDFLVERHGLASVLDYFGRFARDDDRLGHFEAAFGEPLAEFETALDAHLERIR